MEATDIAAVGVAKEYVRLSNEHELDRVFEMFHPQAHYESTALNASFEGIEQIREMMTQFFAKFGDVHWKVIGDYEVEKSETTNTGTYRDDTASSSSTNPTINQSSSNDYDRSV